MDKYNSPKEWGPHFWYMLRCVAFNYPLNPTNEEIKQFKSWFEAFQFILPCKSCKYSLSQHFKKHSLQNAILSREKLMEWVEIIYNETKKTIDDKRVKILNTSIDDQEEDVRPVRI